MNPFARFIFENSPLTSFWAALCAGYVVVGSDGRVYRTASGDEYLESADLR